MKEFSRYSQRGRKRHIALKGDIRELDGKLRFATGKLEKLKVDRARQIRMVAEGQGIYQRNLESTNREILEVEGILKAFEEAKAQVVAELGALEPTPKQAAARLKTQRKIAALLGKREAGDREIERQINQVRESLLARNALNGELLTLLSEIDFEIPRDLDADRFNALLLALPGAGVHAQSVKWLQWFLGGASVHKFTVASDEPAVPETLRSSGVFERGDACLITLEQLAEAEREKPGLMTPLRHEEASGGRPKRREYLPPLGHPELARWLR